MNNQKLMTFFSPNRKYCVYKQPRRAVLYIGSFCPYRCIFCYGKGRRFEPFYSYSDLKNTMLQYWRYGITDLEISGGEPSEMFPSTLIDLISEAKEIGFSKVAVITNGNNFSSFSFLESCKSAGLNEVLFSVHGFNSESHDIITGVTGSWEKLWEAIINAQELNLLVRVNVTICLYNYFGLWSQAKLFTDWISPNLFAVNYIPVNPWEDNIDISGIHVPYSKYREMLYSAVNLLEDNNVSRIAVRYVPFCAFPKINKYVYGEFQHIFDPYDWNRELYGDTSKYPDLMEKPYGFYSWEAAKSARRHLYYKTRRCLKCRYLFICDGIKNGQPHYDISPLEENQPPVQDVMYFQNQN